MVVAAAPEGVNVQVPASDITISPVAAIAQVAPAWPPAPPRPDPPLPPRPPTARRSGSARCAGDTAPLWCRPTHPPSRHPARPRRPGRTARPAVAPPPAVRPRPLRSRPCRWFRPKHPLARPSRHRVRRSFPRPRRRRSHPRPSCHRRRRPSSLPRRHSRRRSRTARGGRHRSDLAVASCLPRFGLACRPLFRLLTARDLRRDSSLNGVEIGAPHHAINPFSTSTLGRSILNQWSTVPSGS